MPDVNIPLLRKAVEWAEAEAAKPWELSQWSQADWITPVTEGVVRPSDTEIDAGWAKADQRKSAECGTCFCVAGYLVTQVLGEHPVFPFEVEGLAADALGVNDDLADLLFDPGNTIKDVRRIAEEIAGERL